MYSLALIIFVVSEKKAFAVETKRPRNDHWKVLYKVSVFLMPIEISRWPPSQDID
jgi:hypothetical protein